MQDWKHINLEYVGFNCKNMEGKRIFRTKDGGKKVSPFQFSRINSESAGLD